MKILSPIVICKNGVRLSVQASEFHYCSPRNNEGPYSSKEVGFIEKDGERYPAPESFKSYADDAEQGVLSDVFGYVPVRLIEQFISDNGGIK